MKSFRINSRVVLSLTALFTLHPASFASTWNEVGDAGDTLLSAQWTVGTGPLTQISGILPNAIDLDLFVIRITDAGNFKAWRYAAQQTASDLWLFDANGYGITHDDSVWNGQTLLTGASVPGNGLYYLGISNDGAEAGSSGGLIWTSPLQYGERAPDGPGAAQPFNGWLSTGLNYDSVGYVIHLEGAEFAVVPEPSALALLALGGLLLARRLGRRRGLAS
jgi:hypothetical protein